MEDDLKIPAAGGTPGSGSGSGRWTPTKEQISMLESLYMQGIRTPSAEQIQEITKRLKEYGHIEGKNVFYWFQNHKARQRQKQKQDHMQLHYLNGYLHINNQDSPLFHPNPNVACNPYYIAQREHSVLSPNYLNPNVLAGGLKKKSRTQKVNPMKESAGVMAMQHRISHQETLDLFPLHPTGILEERSSTSTSSFSSTFNSADNSTVTTPSSLYDANKKADTFFDFF